MQLVAEPTFQIQVSDIKIQGAFSCVHVIVLGLNLCGPVWMARKGKEFGKR